MGGGGGGCLQVHSRKGGGKEDALATWFLSVQRREEGIVASRGKRERQGLPEKSRIGAEPLILCRGEKKKGMTVQGKKTAGAIKDRNNSRLLIISEGKRG